MPRDTDAEFNKLRETDPEEDEEVHEVASTSSAKAAPRKRSAIKKKAVRSSIPMAFKFGLKVIGFKLFKILLSHRIFTFVCIFCGLMKNQKGYGVYVSLSSFRSFILKWGVLAA